MTDMLAPTFPFKRQLGELLIPPVNPGDGTEFPRIGQVVLPTGKTAWLVTGHEEVRQMLRSPAFSSNMDSPGFPLLQARPLVPPGGRAGFFIGFDAPDHTVFRRMLTSEFMIKNMRRLEPLIRETVADAIAAMRSVGPPADLVALFALPVPSMVICHLLGVPYSDHDLFQNRTRILLDRSELPESRQQASMELRAYLAELVERKQVEGGDDLVGRLAAERVAAGELTKAELIGIALLLLIAGHETTANMIGLSTLVLLRQPDELRKLRERPELIDDAVEELLRYLTIVRSGLTRLAIEDVEIGGQLIRAGEGAIAMLSAANRDGGVFPDADELNLDRGSHQHMAFGFGVHQCIGQPLARAELRVALAELVVNFPNLALAEEPSDVDARDESIVYGLNRLQVTW
jgi:cytochrome P450